MGIALIAADNSFVEMGEISEFNQFDAQISLTADAQSNDFMLELPVAAWQNMPITTGCYVYIDSTEWGGPVERVRHSSADNTVRIYGTCWRGLLNRRIVCPASGSTHVSFCSQEANSILSSLLGGWHSELFSVSAQHSTVTCTGQIRYKPLLEAIYSLLDVSGGRLQVIFSQGVVSLAVLPVRDMSDDVEFSQDYEAKLTSDDETRIYNHIIALGRGEMLDRTVIELWRLSDGTITSDSSAAGLPNAQNTSTLLYDYPSVESDTELQNAALKKLLAEEGAQTLEIELTGIDTELELTDVASVRDKVTGLTAPMRVTEKNLNISSSGITIKHKLGQL